MIASDPIELSTVQPGLEAYRAPEGYVAYVQRRGRTLTLGAPVCAPDARAKLARSFIDAFPNATFFYVTNAQLEQMSVAPKAVWAIGADQVLALPCPQWSREVDSARRKAVRAGLTLTELKGEALGPWAQQMREAQAAYLRQREVKQEMGFLTRPCRFSDEREGRTFIMQVKGTFLGFVVLDPYATASGPGYLLNLFRIHPTKLWGVYPATVALLAELLAAEGAAELSLGFVPAAATDQPMPWWLRAQVSALQWFASRSKYLCSLARMKGMFATKAVPRLCASPRRLIVSDLLALLEAQSIVLPGGAA